MTKHNLTALDLFIIQDTIYQSLRISNYSGRGTVEGRQHVLEKICDIMSSINVEILTDTPNPETITADSGV
jgi:hypothetical protein